MGSERIPGYGAANQVGRGMVREVLLLRERRVKIHSGGEDWRGRSGLSCRGHDMGKCMDVGKAQ